MALQERRQRTRIVIVLSMLVAQLAFCALAANDTLWNKNLQTSFHSSATDQFSLALMLISCYGWVGLFFLGVALYLVLDGMKKK